MAEIISNEVLAKINKFTRRELKADEVHCFSVVLCDNQIDRDNERFSIDALKKLAALFVGKTGIFDHNPKGSNQTARIFETEVVSDTSKSTVSGEPYTYIKATAYMVKTTANEDLIKEIDAGIKKEVSISCCIEKQLCSVCKTDLKKNICSHRKGKIYNGQKCHVVLDCPTDAYEWSFVTVPAQVKAGVTKHFAENGFENETVVLKSELENLKNLACEQGKEIEALKDYLKRDIIKLSFLCHPEASSNTIVRIAEGMTIDELVTMKRKLEITSKSLFAPQTFVTEKENKSSNQQFKL